MSEWQTPRAAQRATEHRRNTGPIGETRSIGLSILWFILTLGIYGIYWTYKTFEEMKRHTSQGIGGVLGVVIHLVIGVVNWFVIPSEVGQMYKRDGREAPVTGITGLVEPAADRRLDHLVREDPGRAEPLLESKGATA